MRRIAFFGGSFDPPHRGHLAIAAAAADRFALDQVLFAPVGRQPLKGKYPATDFLHRYTMTALATQADARFVPSLLDAPQSSGTQETRPNYTVETLARLRALLAAEPEPTELFTLLGADSWLDIGRWFQASRLLALTDWIVAARPGFSLASAEAALPAGITSEKIEDSTEQFFLLHHAHGNATQVFFLPCVQEDISATELRSALDAGSVDKELLPAAVREYIRKTGLYSRQSLNI
jgi:nicotinate-nucleotide adenylyltransferase